VVVVTAVLPAWKDRVPYPVVLVECEEGVRTIGGLVGATAEDLRMDMPMVVDFAPSPDGTWCRSAACVTVPPDEAWPRSNVWPSRAFSRPSSPQGRPCSCSLGWLQQRLGLVVPFASYWRLPLPEPFTDVRPLSF